MNDYCRQEDKNFLDKWFRNLGTNLDENFKDSMMERLIRHCCCYVKIVYGYASKKGYQVSGLIFADPSNLKVDPKSKIAKLRNQLNEKNIKCVDRVLLLQKNQDKVLLGIECKGLNKDDKILEDILNKTIQQLNDFFSSKFMKIMLSFFQELNDVSRKVGIIYIKVPKGTSVEEFRKKRQYIEKVLKDKYSECESMNFEECSQNIMSFLIEN